MVSVTHTTKEVLFEKGINSGILGDKYTYEQSMSKTIGKANGLINIDLATNISGDFDSITFSSLTGGSTGVSGSGMLTVGQSIGNSEYHLGLGIGVGLGELNIGSSSTNDVGAVGGDINIRPGAGTLIVAGAIYTAPAWLPAAASAAPVAGAVAIPIMLKTD